MLSPIVLAIIYFPLLISCVIGLKNVNNLQQFIATQKIEAEFYTTATYANIYDDCTQDPSIFYLGDMSTGTVLEYDDVNFGDGVQRVSFRVANVDPETAVVMELRLTRLSNPPFLTVPINSTGSDKCGFVTVDVAIDIYPTGTQILYLTIASGKGGQLFLDWFQFNSTSGGRVIPATEIIQAEDFDYAEELVVYTNCSDTTVYPTDYDSLAEYYRVDFGAGVHSVKARGYSKVMYYAENVEFRVGSASNAAFATVSLNYTGASCGFTEGSAGIKVPVTGVQNLYLTFSQSSNDVYVDYFVFAREDGQFNATDKIEAEDYTSAKNVTLYADCGDPNVTYVGQLQSNTVLEYDGVDFGVGVETVTLRVSSTHTGPPLNVTLHLGSSTASALANVPVGQTGTDNCDFYTIASFLYAQPSGVQNLFITFPAAEGRYLNLDWFAFNRTIN